MATRSLSESFEVLGDWFLPDQPDRIIAGNLHYTKERTELHLNESFQPLHGSIRAGDPIQSYPLVHGTTTKGEAMTLLKAQRRGTSLNIGSGGMRQPESLISSWLLIGAHVPADFAYPAVSFRVPALQVWLSQQIIEQSSSTDPSTGRYSLEFLVRAPKAVITDVPLIDASLEWGFRWNSNGDPFSSISLVVSAWITIKPSSPQVMEWYFEQQSKLAAMLAFIAGTPMAPDCIEANIDVSHNTVNVMVAMRDVDYCSYGNIHDFFISRGALGVELQVVVSRWFEKYPKVQETSQLALSILGSKELWLHVEFLSLMQALEGFHRGLFDGNYMDDEKYESVKKVLGDAIPSTLGDDHKASLRSRIKYGNQVALGKRLTALANLLSDPLKALVLGRDGKVPRTWIDTRNYYTHWDENLRASILDSHGMYYANLRMRLLVSVLYLDLMGIPQQTILQSLGNVSDTSQNLLYANAIERRRVDPNDTSGVIMTLTEFPQPTSNDPTTSSDEVPPTSGDTISDC